MPTRPWPPGSVTGLGSMPGTDPTEAITLVLGELADLPYLPELPDRGPGAAMIGRTAALLVDLPVEIAPTGWRLTTHDGRELRRARDDLARDLDALEQQADGYVGPLKLQAAGPWTLAAELELPNGHRVVRDRGAVRDLTASLVEGLRAHLADVARRVPGATLVVQLDEPGLPAVLAGRVPTPSGYGTVRAIEPAEAGPALRDVLDVADAGGRVVHCCAPDVPIALLRDAGADAVSLDATLLDRDDYDALGEAIDAGVALWLGVLDPTDPDVGLDRGRRRVESLWSALGFPSTRLAADVVGTPTCGLAGASGEQVRRVLRTLRDLGRWLTDQAG